MHRRLIVASRPLHGLGNRVRLVLSGQALALAEGRLFSYYWPVGRGFGARLTDLWEYPESIPAAVDVALRAVAPFRNPAEVVGDPAFRSVPLWHFRSGSALPLPPGTPGWDVAFADLPLRAALAETVRTVHAREFAAEPYVGVMLRTHPNAHELTKLHSPISWYVDRMREFREEHPGIRFYLSCDTPDGEQELQRLFPGSVSLPKTGGYNTRQAIIDSVVDLYLLASSAHILGPHHSSFPELAHLLTLRQVPLETSVGESYARIRPQVVLSIAPDPVVPRVRHIPLS